MNPLLVTSLRKVRSDKAGTFTRAYSYKDRAPKNIIYIDIFVTTYIDWVHCVDSRHI